MILLHIICVVMGNISLVVVVVIMIIDQMIIVKITHNGHPQVHKQSLSLLCHNVTVVYMNSILLQIFVYYLVLA